MKAGNTVTGFLIACMACVPALQSIAQDTTLTTKPVTIQEINQSDGDGAVATTGSALNTRVKVNINNDNLRDAIKKVIGKAEVTYEIDADVPEDVKVSLKADNILLSTAINVIIESAGIGCTESNRRATIETKEDAKRIRTARVHLHFRKAPTPPLGQGPSSWMLNIPNTVFDKTLWKDGALTLPKLTLPNGTINQQFGSTLFSPNGATDYTNKLLDGLKVYSTDANGSKPLLYNLTSSEERSTFTCPHCHEQVTVIKKHVAPKCPTCGRTFQDDWKFCPVDGAKRPEDAGEWKFCPHCGKPVS